MLYGSYVCILKEMEEPVLCPVCKQELVWKQLNLKEAVEICQNLKCPFPLGGKCRVRQRDVMDINNIPKAPVRLDELLNIENENTPLLNDDFLEDLNNFLFGDADNN